MKVSAKQYAQTLFELTENKSNAEVQSIIVQFVTFVKKMGDMKKSHDVISQFNNIHNKKNNIVEATVTSARELNTNEQEKVQAFIRKQYTATNVVLRTIIDKDIKGGIVVRVGDEILDGSINGRLNKLKLNLNK